MQSYPLRSMRRELFPEFEGAALEPRKLSLRMSDSVRVLLEEMKAGMHLPKGVIGGHAIEFLIALAETKKAHDALDERAASIGREPSRVEHITAPGPVIDWLMRAAASYGDDPRVPVEAAIKLWYASWAGNRVRAAVRGRRKTA